MNYSKTLSNTPNERLACMPQMVTMSRMVAMPRLFAIPPHPLPPTPIDHAWSKTDKGPPAHTPHPSCRHTGQATYLPIVLRSHGPYTSHCFPNTTFPCFIRSRAYSASMKIIIPLRGGGLLHPRTTQKVGVASLSEQSLGKSLALNGICKSVSALGS